MTKNAMKRTIQVASTFVIQGAILFIFAWTFRWIWAWLFLALCLTLLIANYFVIPLELIEERGKKKEDAKKWDKIITSINIIPTLLLYTCCGLDYRFGWTGDIHMVIHLAGFAFTCAGSLLFTWSMISNKHFSTLVRLQVDRDHTVAAGGPYQYVRHPGYVGYMIMSLATPIALGSLWGLVFSGLTVLLLVARTVLEDKTLKKELPGYAEYAAKVKFRLVPYIW